MKFLAITLITDSRDPVTGAPTPTRERFREVVAAARLAEQLGFDGFGVGERHERPFLSSSPPVVLGHIAALTRRIRLFTAVTTLRAEVLPRPFQRNLRVWHGSATSRESVDLAARYGDPLFSANVTHPIGPYAELIRYYRERWEHYGHDPAHAVVGAGTAGYHAAPTSQQAVRAYRPAFARYLAFHEEQGLEPVFPTLEDFVERSSALIGSPQQVIEKVHRYHEEFGHTALHLQAEAGGLTPAEHRASLELFQSEIAPVLRRAIPDPSFPHS
ncbi:LLM class flavin-dependent oxidoreductase [Streptomyces erythrochromogenes]|uniref:LLM class flavin-dependent oxidoreductase n=1 Tax=Streptomyces erythrochromogenes TaxID=285574 RepID=UPI0037D01322